MKRFSLLIFLIVAGLLLWALLFPAVRVGPGDGKRARAKNDVVQLTVALSAYKTEYGVYPSGNYVELLKILQGDNLRKIVFIELQPKQFDRAGRLLDPWGLPYHITIPDSGEKPQVWSSGKNKRDESGTDGSDDISSWN